MNHIAIRNLYPNVDTIIETEPDWTITDSNGQSVKIDMELVAAETARLKAQVDDTEYQRKRALEYPNIKDLADAIYWQSQGDNTKMEAYLAAVQSVKDKYPKGV